MPCHASKHRSGVHFRLIVLVVCVVLATLTATEVVAKGQDEVPFEFTVYKVNCEEEPDLPPGDGEPDDPITDIMPEGCTIGARVTFIFYSDADGSELDRCTTDSTGACTAFLPVNFQNSGVDGGDYDYFIIKEDETTGEPGFSPVENPMRVLYVPNEFTRPYQNIVNVRDETTELPETGVGLATPRAHGTWSPVLLSVAVLFTVAGARVRDNAHRRSQ